MTTLTRTAWAIVYAAVASFAVSCHHDPSGPDDERQPFSLTVTAKDAAGKAVPGLRVSAYYAPTVAGISKAPARRQTQMLASSMVSFDAAYPAVVDLSLHELNGTLVQQLIDHQLLNSGRYMHTLSLRVNVGTRVYVCRLTVTDTSTAAVAFRDSIYVTVWQPDPALAVLGYTGTTGAFEMKDSLAFPHLLSLPQMLRTDVSPTVIGTFSFPDSVNIVLTDTSSRRSLAVVREILHGANAVAITWNPGLPKSSVLPSATLSAGAVSMDPSVVHVPTQWKLYQNYPNPFN